MLRFLSVFSGLRPTASIPLLSAITLHCGPTAGQLEHLLQTQEWWRPAPAKTRQKENYCWCIFIVCPLLRVQELVRLTQSCASVSIAFTINILRSGLSKYENCKYGKASVLKYRTDVCYCFIYVSVTRPGLRRTQSGAENPAHPCNQLGRRIRQKEKTDTSHPSDPAL